MPRVGSEPARHPAAAATGDERGRAVREMFSDISPTYDLVNHVASAGLDLRWRALAATELGLRPGDWCLDACCGTGDFSRAVAGLGVRVLGVDFCRPMLRLAERKAARPGRSEAPRPRFAEGDALHLPVRAGSMDAACVGFGLRNLSDPSAGLLEMVRVVRPGGRLAVLEFTTPESAWVRLPYRIYSRHVLPLLGDLLSRRRGTYRYLPETIQAWYGKEALTELMLGSGCQDVRCHVLSAGIVALHVGVVGPRGAAADRLAVPRRD